jgi:putative ABC transport system substrate-binding protein
MISTTKLIVAIAVALFVCTLPANAQQPTRIPRVGILSDETPSLGTSFELIADGLRRLGYVEGKNIAFEPRHAAGNYEVLPSLAGELVGLHPDVIIAIGTLAVRAAKTATQTIPIVFARISDPVGLGFVAALARPGGNLTGVSLQSPELAAKRLQLLSTAVPEAKRVGVLWDPRLPAGPEFGELEAAARSLNLELVPAEVRGPDDFEPALRALTERHAGALILMAGPIFSEHVQRMVDLTAKARLPVMFYRREQVEAGGLISYYPDRAEQFRRAAAYVDKILKGAKPADLPVEQPTKFELVVNLKTAKALGLTIPYSLLGRADRVIE